jgi:hypothetical protein
MTPPPHLTNTSNTRKKNADPRAPRLPRLFGNYIYNNQPQAIRATQEEFRKKNADPRAPRPAPLAPRAFCIFTLLGLK